MDDNSRYFLSGDFEDMKQLIMPSEEELQRFIVDTDFIKNKPYKKGVVIDDRKKRNIIDMVAAQIVIWGGNLEALGVLLSAKNSMDAETNATNKALAVVAKWTGKGLKMYAKFLGVKAKVVF